MRAFFGLLRALLLTLGLGLTVLAACLPRVDAQEGLVTFEPDSLAIHTTGGTEIDFRIELAVNSAQHAQGLMYRRSLAEDAGMLFVYRPARRVSMWMKNTVIPLDMLFIAEDGGIVKIVQRTVPFSLTPISSDQPIRAVLEVNGGTINRLGIQPGDRVVHPAFDANP